MSDASHGGDHGGSGGSMSPLAKAIIAGIIVLVLLNGNMPVNTQFALVVGVAVYLFATRKKGGDAH
jgi:hypothetical protein